MPPSAWQCPLQPELYTSPGHTRVRLPASDDPLRLCCSPAKDHMMVSQGYTASLPDHCTSPGHTRERPPASDNPPRLRCSPAEDQMLMKLVTTCRWQHAIATSTLHSSGGKSDGRNSAARPVMTPVVAASHFQGSLLCTMP